MLQLLNDIHTEHDIKFLVIDSEVEKLFSYLFQNPSELLNYVTAVDKIDSPKRKGQSSVDAIYLLRPTKFNINCIDSDFKGRPQRYKRAHIRFLPGFEGYLVKFFHSKRYLNQNMASLSEAKFGFIPKESQFFQTMGIDRPLQIFFNKQCGDLIERNIKRTIQSLLNLCIITGEYPIVRYSEPLNYQVELTPATKLVKKLAFEFQNALDNYARNNQDFPPVSNRPRAIFLITDRTLDLFSPVIHDFSYQAMAYDLINEIDVTTDVYHYTAETELGEQEEKSAKLSALLDPDWVELKHQHIADASEYLAGKIKEMIAKNPLLVDRSNVKNTTDLLSVVAHLKNFDEERRRMILHRTLIDACLITNKDRDLSNLADAEQILVGYGLDMDGEKVKHLLGTLLPILLLKTPSVTDKVRCILIYAIFRGGIIVQDFIKLLSFIGVTEDHEYYSHFMSLFKNFDSLGFKLIKKEPRSKPFVKEWFHDTIIKDSTVYTTSRFIPAVGSTLSKAITNPLLLSEESFPYVKDKPIELLDDDAMAAAGAAASANSSASLRNPRHKATWTKHSNNNNNSQNKPPRQRFFYYILGGVTYPEIKAAYDQSFLKNKDVFIGSDGIITPLAFMKSVEYLTAPREHLELTDDIIEKDIIPDFLVDSSENILPPVSHVHVHSHNPPVQQNIPIQSDKVANEGNEKEKKKKFGGFFRSKK